MKNGIIRNLVKVAMLFIGNCLPLMSEEPCPESRSSADQASVKLTDSKGSSLELKGTVRPGDQEGVFLFNAVLEQKESLREWTQERIGQRVVVGLTLEDGRTEDVIVPIIAALPGEFQLVGLSLDFLNGQEIPPEDMPRLYSEAEKGDAEAQLLLGDCFCSGRNVPKSPEQAVIWWLKAAEQGAPEAMYNLGCAYSLGDGVPQNDEEAYRWWRKGAEAGDVHAQSALGDCYRDGTGVSSSEAEALKWWRKAAEQDVPEALYNLAYCYTEGIGVEQSNEKAVFWFSKAAEQGDEMAMYSLAHFYEQGLGVEKDPEWATLLYLKAATRGYRPAQEVLEERGLWKVLEERGLWKQEE